MVDKVQINLGAGANLGLSGARIERLLSGNLQGARQMGALDRFKDLFRSESKQAALDAMVQQFQNIPSNVGAESQALATFQRLSEFAVCKSDLSVAVSPANANGMTQVDFLVRGEGVSSVEMHHTTAMATLGRVDVRHLTHAGPALWLDEARLDDIPQHLTSEDFAAGGVHKKVAVIFDLESGKNRPVGLLRADDRTGARDFEREQEVHLRAQQPYAADLRRYVSTQSQLQHEELPPPLQGTGRPYAKFDIYDPARVESGELDNRLTELTSDQSRSVLAQTVDMLKVFYLHDVSHRDLHMHNLMLYQDKAHPENLVLKAIDFGKTQIGQHQDPSERLDDLRYMFNKKAIDFGDKFRRSYREAGLPGANIPTTQKHYPLHRLLAQAKLGNDGGTLDQRVSVSAEFDDLVAHVGQQLFDDLRAAHLDRVSIENAFARAAYALDDAARRAAERPPPQQGWVAV